MSTRGHSEIAHRRRGAAQARGPVWAILLVAASGAAQSKPGALPLAHEKELVELLESDDARLRGEAAIGLALGGNDAHYESIVEIARDDAEAARLRGLAALGILGAAGVEAIAGEHLLEDHHDEPERHVAAFAIGALPEERPAGSIDQYLVRIDGGSFKRHRDTLAGLLFGLGQSEHPSRAAAIRQLLTDESNRDPGLHLLAFRALARIDGALFGSLVADLLESRHAIVRRYVLELLSEVPDVMDATSLDLLPTLASTDRDPLVRGCALRALVAVRSTRALELIPRALASRSPDELAAGVYATLKIGGGELRLALERRIVRQEDPVRQAAMLEAWRGRSSPAFAQACFEIAAKSSHPVRLRVAAAVIVARAGQKRIVPVLRRLSDVPQSAESLAICYRQFAILSDDDDPAERAFPVVVADDDRLPVQLEAMFRSGHPAAMDLLRRALRDDRFDSSVKTRLLAAWRRSVMPPPRGAELESLPEALAEILR
jgi:hypothetical protein